MRFSDDVLAMIRDRTSITSLVESAGVELRRAGHGSAKGLCPFHDERTPSFNVREAYGTFRCFGCGENGDVFTFIMRTQALDFPEAVRALAEPAGVTLPDPSDDGDDAERMHRDRLRAAMTAAADLYQGRLNSADAAQAQHQLASRHFTPDHARVGGCGYAPADTGALLAALREHGVSTDDAIEAGLLREHRGHLSAVFRDRLTFTIRDRRGQPIGFGARRLSDRDPIAAKYVNTAETPLYRKSDVLYGWDRARSAAAKAGRIFVMEGYTDVMAGWAAGVDECVASCGTAFGPGQVEMLTRGLPTGTRIVFCFDGDDAGVKATQGAWRATLSVASRADAVLASPGDDPCTVWERDGGEGVRALLEKAQPLTRTVLALTLDPALRAGEPERVSAAAAECAALLDDLPDPVMAHQYRALLSERLGAPLPAAPRTHRRHGSDTPPPPDEQGLDSTPPTQWGISEAPFLLRLATDPKARQIARDAAFPHQAMTPVAQAAWHALMAAAPDEGAAGALGRVETALREEHPGAHAALLATQPLTGDAAQCVHELGHALIRDDLDAQIHAATRAAAAGDPDAYDRWTELLAIRDAHDATE